MKTLTSIALVLSTLALTVACAGGTSAPKAPSGEQLITLATSATERAGDLTAQAQLIADEAKALGADPDKLLAALKFGQTLARRAVLVATAGLEACSSLPSGPPYSDVCAKLPEVKLRAEQALDSLSFLRGTNP